MTDAPAELEDSGAAAAREEAAANPDATFARGARILSIGIAATGIFSFAYFGVSSHVLSASLYGAIALLWSILFVVISVIYRPVEQLLSRSIADRRARGLHTGHPLRVPLGIQGGFALFFLVVALALRPEIENLFGDSASLYWIFVGAALAYAASYFARGYFAGHQWFGLYGGLVLFESVSRFCFPVAVAVGLASGQTAVALGILAAPLASLIVVPLAIARHRRLDAEAPLPDPSMTLRAGAGFAFAVAGHPARRAGAAERRRDRRGRRVERGRRGRGLQRAADHARAAPALPVRADLAAATSRRPRGDRGPRVVQPRDPSDGARRSPASR